MNDIIVQHKCNYIMCTIMHNNMIYVAYTAEVCKGVSQQAIMRARGALELPQALPLALPWLCTRTGLPTEHHSISDVLHCNHLYKAISMATASYLMCMYISCIAHDQLQIDLINESFVHQS